MGTAHSRYRHVPGNTTPNAPEDFYTDSGPDAEVLLDTPYQHVAFRAAKAGHLGAVKHWVEEKEFYLEEEDFYSNTLLYYAVLCNRPRMVAYLLERGAAFSRKEPEGHRIYICSTNEEIRNLLVRVEQAAAPRKFPEMWFSNYVNSTELSDLHFVVSSDPSSPIPAHRAIIAARCPALIAKLEPGANTITIEGPVTRKDFIDFLYYLYTDKVNITPQNKAALQKLGEDFSITAFDKRTQGTLLAQSLSHFINSSQYSDIAIVSSDGQVVNAHKAIIAHKSDYFKALFSNKWSEKDTTRIEVDIPFSVISVLLQYIYTRTYQVTAENILEVIAAADRFLLSQLKYELEIAVVTSYMDMESCIDLFIFASETVNCAEIRKAALSKFAQCQKKIEETQQFQQLDPKTKAALRKEKHILT